MAHEVERKFLVASDAWRGGDGTRYRPGYLINSEGRTVRVRLSDGSAWLKSTHVSSCHPRRP